MPEQNQYDHILDELIMDVGHNKFKEYLFNFLDYTKIIAEENASLTNTSNLTDAEYNIIVERILKATNDYYKYIGKLPEKVSKFFNSMFGADMTISDNLKKLGSITDINLADISYSLFSKQSIRPQKYTMQLDAITNRLATLNEINIIPVGNKGNQSVRTTVTLEIPDHMKIEGGGMLSTYDKSIINGVTSLIESGNTFFSIPMLYHAMTGRQNPTVDEQLSEEISQKLEKMRRMMITIDLFEEGDAHFIADECGNKLRIEDLIIEGYLMPLNRIRGSVNGKQTDLYQILQHPPIYSYSKLKRQLASIPISLLGAPVNNNATTIPLKTYLLQRVEMMKNKNNRISSNTILYNTIYEELGVVKANKTKKMRVRLYTETILEYFVEKDYIKGYTTFKSGRNIAGIQIII